MTKTKPKPKPSNTNEIGLELDVKSELDKIETVENNEPVKKTRKRRTVKKKTEFTPQKSDLKPYFDTLNLMFKSIKTERLDDDEIHAGIESWYPVYCKYFESFMENMMYVAPAIWSIAIVVPRVTPLFSKSGKKVNEPEKENEKENDLRNG